MQQPEAMPSTTKSHPNRRALLFNALDGTRSIFVPDACRVYSLDDGELTSYGPQQNPIEVPLSELPELEREVGDELDLDGVVRNERVHTPGIAIVTTQHCNLTCSYCLAKQGTFGLDVSSTSLSVIKRQIKTLFDEHPNIDFIKFFGGEPTLRMDVIKEVCRYVTSDLDRRVQFAVTTNGTLPPESHIDTWRRFHVSVAVSIDGPEKIHDACRVDSRGEGSHFKALTYADYLSKHKFPFAVVGVFDERHLKAGISYLDTIRYLNSVSPLTKVQFLEALGEAAAYDVLAETGVSDINALITAQVEEAVDAVIDRATSTWVSPATDWLYDNNLMRFIYGIVSGHARPYRHACTASNLTTIFPGGEVMPCYTFAEDADFHYGKASDLLTSIEEKRKIFNEKLTWSALGARGVRVPWYRGVVGDVCVADMRNSAIDGVPVQSSFYATFQETAVRRILQQLVPVSKNSQSLVRLKFAVAQHQKITGRFTGLPVDVLGTEGFAC